MTELFKGVFSGGKSRLYAVLFLLAVMLEVAGYADSGRMGERKESNVQVSGKVVDVYEEAITHDKALPSSTDRGNGMMVALIEDLNAYEKMCKQLQLLGVTEITDFDAKAIIPIPGNMRFPMEPNLDVLDMEVAVAKKHGINKIWLVYGWAAYGEQMSATDKRVNAMTPEFFEEQCRFMDAVAKKNTQYGKNIFGFFFDEPWFNSSMTDFSAHVDSFRVFCEKEYGEIYPGTTLPKTDNPEDKWWRRLVVFRYCVYEGFFRKICEYAKSRNIQVQMRTMYTPLYYRGWVWGHDPYRVSKIGDYQWLPVCFERMFNYENTVAGYYRSLGRDDFFSGVRGYPCTYFQYQSYILDIMNIRQYDELVNLAREWLGAEQKADVAVMTYPVGLIGGFKNPRGAFLDNDNMLWGSMKGLCSTDMVDVRDTRFYGKYKILVAPKYCGYSVPQYVIDDLMKYVNSGGILISFDARFAVGKRDLTNPRDVSEQLYGFDFSNEETEVKELIFPGSPDAPTLKGKGRKQKKIRFLDKQNIEILASSVPENEPVIVERKIGGGKVIYVNLDFAERVKTDRAWTKLLAFLAGRNAKLPASISPGAMSLQSVIRKGERTLFSLSAETNAQDLLKIDTAGLGLKAEKFQAMRLTENALIKRADGSESWSCADLKAGLPVTIKKETGYENIVLEPVGQKHVDKGIETKLNEIRAQWDEEVRQARLHPRGLGGDPFRKRISLRKNDGASDSVGQPQSNLPDSFAMEITPPKGVGLANQPIVIDKKQLGELVQKDIGKAELYREGENNKIAVQVDKDEIIFIDNFKEGANRYVLCFDRDGNTQKNHPAESKTNELETAFYSAKINGKGEISVDGHGNMPLLKLNGPGGYEVQATAYSHDGVLRWNHRGPIYYQAEFVNTVNGVNFKARYEFFNGSPYVSIAYSSDQNRQLETALYWPLGYLTKIDDQVEFLAASHGWIRMRSGKKWSFLPFMDERYVLVRQKDAGFAWVLLSSTFTTPPYIMIGSDRGYFITRFSEDHLIPVLVNKPETEFLYVTGVASEESMKKIIDGLKEKWIIQILPP